MGAKSNLYRDVKNYLRTAQAAIKNNEIGIADEALKVVNEIYTKASNRFPNLDRKDLPNYSIKDGIVKETNLKGLIQPKKIENSFKTYFKNVADTATEFELEKIKKIQPNVYRVVDLFKKGKKDEAYKLIEKRLPEIIGSYRPGVVNPKVTELFSFPANLPQMYKNLGKGARRTISIGGGVVLPELIFKEIDKANMMSKGMSEKEATQQSYENATFGAYQNKEYMNNLKKVAGSMGIDARAFNDVYNLNVAGQTFDKYLIKGQERVKNLKELGFDKRADDAQKNLDRYIEEQNKNLDNLSQKVIDQISISKAGGAAPPSQLSKARDILTEEDFYKPFQDITKVAKEKLTREKRKAFDTQKFHVDTAAGEWGERFYKAFDALTQGAKNVLQGRIIPYGPERFRPKESERQKEKRYLDEIGSKFIPGTKIPNPKYHPRELYLYNRDVRNLTYDQPLTEGDLMELQAYQPGVFYSKGGRAGYMGGGITNLKIKW
jgi:hypothetical protein